MKNNKTHITVLLDRSGSMEAIRDDVIGGYNSFLGTQQQQPGDATLSLTQFDLVDPREIIHWFRPLLDVPALNRDTFVPRAGTPFYDAIGWSIRGLEKALERMPEAERPGRVIVAIFSDGQENSSHRYSQHRIARMIEEKQGEGWQFTYQGADLAGIHEAIACGIPRESTMAFTPNARGTAMAWNSISSAISSYRQGACEEVSFRDEPVDSPSPASDWNSLQKN